ncbi:pentapeptide repeat-containing protein [Streptomyces sp. NPDC020800]|uniref:pentapeptide repeat-containing protein n=1 Tax=Streptomyces sp. NPDC020800 TaxID=3365092 RepID=UPI003799F5B0
MSTSPPPSWPHCGQGADPGTDPIGCRGIHVPGHTMCLAHLTCTIWFNGAQFSGDARFDSARFTGKAGFDRAQFSGSAVFNEVRTGADWR